MSDVRVEIATNEVLPMQSSGATLFFGRAILVAIFGVKTGKMAEVMRETSMGWDQSSRFVKEARVNKGGFFEDNQVAACAFCRAHLVIFM